MSAGMRIRVATLNVWALPLGLAPRRAERIRAIGARLARHEADVWALQEVWTGAAREALARDARAAGYTVVHGGGGLLLASRLPVEESAFRPFALAGIATHVHRGDYQGGKGFLTARLRTPEGPLVVVDTHLHAQYAPDGADPFFAHRVGQVVELAAAVAPVAAPLVLAGDFNAREDRPEYAILRGLTGVRDAAAELDRREPTSSSGTRIDYVFTRGPQPRAARVFLEQGTYSDHAGLLVELERAPGHAARPDPDAAARAREILARGQREAAVRRRRERGLAAGAAGLGVGALVARRAVSRRRFLLAAGAAAALPAAALLGVSAERWVAGEVEAFGRVAGLLPGAAPSPSGPQSAFSDQS